jgi:hypothetical protein
VAFIWKWLVASLGFFSLSGNHILFTNQILLFLDGKHPGCDQSYVRRREFSFTLENDIYLRFQSFDSVAELESSIKEKCPFKIDIGPVYSVDV